MEANYLLVVICNDQSCIADNKSDCNKVERENKYSRESNEKFKEYFDNIKKAKESYQPCDKTKCRCHSNVIQDDLKRFKDGITKELVGNIKTKGTKYQIINHKLYRDPECMFPARCSGIEHFILEILPDLPNMEFIVNTRDWPQIHKQYGAFGPVFSFSKSNDYYDIMYPAWAFWEGGPAIELYPKGIGRWDIHRKQLSKIADEIPWEEKIEKAFFRGSRTSPERDPLVLLSREEPDLADAQYTKNQAWKTDADTLHAVPASEISFAEHCKYKYLFNFRGVAASFRFKHILLCKSLVFHVGNEWLEFFYPALKPWIHYIPVDAKATKSEIRELVEFVKNNDAIAREIAENGYQMIWDNLKMKDVSCYWKKLLKQYAKLLKYEPVMDENVIEIKK
ncbi:kdel lys-asp-glu-leu containing - related [Holotrichia oblita]|uniref:Kdel lys-asp-glu-leu containing - related n=1 Tax=Holotrichia oblita TaxID=644536 RepID=A0ACB9TC22_HOLOL|nr:kdel lys-asp-glu-leu containing - related [Holotrichia oblita]